MGVRRLNQIKRLYEFTIGQRSLLVFGALLSLIAVGLNLFGPFILKIILDNYLVKDNIVVKGIVIMLLVYLLVEITNGLVAYYSKIITLKAGSKVIQNIRLKVFRHIQKLPVRYFDNLPAGKVVARITNDTETILTVFTQVLSQLITSGFTIIGVVIASFIVNVYAGLLMLLILPVLFLWLYLYRKASNKYNMIKREKNSEMNASINESISGMSVIQAFNNEDKVFNEFLKLNEDYYESSVRLSRLNALTNTNLIESLKSVVLMFLIFVFSYMFLFQNTTWSIGSMYLMIDYAGKIMMPLYGIIGVFDVIEQARVATNKVYELLDEEEEKEDTGELKIFNGNIEFKDVNFSYVKGHPVLNDINFKVNQNETLALVGHTGSGKSSIINLLMRFYDPDSGEILFDDIDTKTINKQSMRKHMAIVLQDPYIYNGTLLYNIRLGNESITEKEATDALISVGGEMILKRFKNGIHEELIESGSTLSLGERQLISFARALAFKPTLLILDEATSNVDSETEQLVQRAMKIVSSNRTTVIIAHRLSTIQHADQILLLDKGNIVESGNHQTLIAEDGKYKEMYYKQVMKK